VKVVIVGAGLGGLTLAHGLRTAGIGVEVHERGPRSGPQPASYGIHLGPAAHRALRACLPPTNWERYDQGSVSAPDVVRFRGTDLGLLGELVLGDPADETDPVAHRRAVRRDALHRALLDGLADEVHWDSAYADHEVRADGRVRVEFADGTTTVGDVLVGADGSNSGVRRRSRPDVVRHDLGVLNVAGRLPLDDPAVRALPADLVDGSVNNVVPTGPGWMFVSTWPDGDDGDDDGDGGKGDGPGVLVWAYAAARSAYPEDVEHRSAADLRRLVATRVGSWDDRIPELVTCTGTDTVAPVVLRSTGELARRDATPVTLLGDAAHTMSPMAGVGAATALRDADALRRALVADGPARLTERIAAYEDEMRAYANEALRTSTRNTRNAASRSRLPRLAFRSLLRVGEAVPRVKERVLLRRTR
jgi:2-polyprenyl-6-methoxyphenol hydroxylase-like FAD-dependent oxidoreductase